MGPSAWWRNPISLVSVVACLGLASLPATGARAQSAGPSTATQKEIRGATVLFYAALNSALQGNLAPIDAIWSHRPDVSDLDGAGARALGWNEVRADFQKMARLYPEGRVTPQDMVVVADGDIGYSVCTETGQLRSPEGPIVRFTRHSTNIFRREDGRWKMVHRHADASSALPQGTSR